MPICLLHPPSLARLAQDPPDAGMPDLEVEDTRDDYATLDGDGIWIREYIDYLERIVRERGGLPGFAFSDNYRLDLELFEEIPVAYLRALLIEFTNHVYPGWKDSAVDLPDYDDIRGECRGYCDDCENAYEEIYGTYDGPLAEEVEADEDECDSEISFEERQARILRNIERADERRSRQADREAAESEVVDTEWVCDDDCTGFIDYVDEEFVGQVEVETASLDDDWEAFLEEKGVREFPPLLVELARQTA